MDCISTGVFGNGNSSNGGRSNSTDSVLRHSADGLHALKAAGPGLMSGGLASRLGLSVRTSRRSGSFGAGSHSHGEADSDCLGGVAAVGSPIAASDFAASGRPELSSVQRSSAAAAAGVGSGRCESHEVTGSCHSSSGGSAAAAPAANRHGVAPLLSSKGAALGSSTSSSSSVGGAAGSALLLGPLNSNRYFSAQSHESGDSCGSHRLSTPGASEASQPGEAGHGGKNSTSTSTAASHVGSKAAPRPSHLRPVSPKSRALKDLASPTLAGADSPAAAAGDGAGDAAAALVVVDATAGAAAEEAAAAAAAGGQSACVLKSSTSVADAVAELLQPISKTSGSSKVTFLKSLETSGSKLTTTSSSNSSAALTGTGTAATPERLRVTQSATFGRVWDKWAKMKLASPRSSPKKGQQAGSGDSGPAATAAAAGWTEQQAAAAAVTAAAMEAAALELGMLVAATTADTTAAGADGVGETGPAAGGSRQAAAGKAGEKLAAWPLDLEADLEYEAAVS